MSITITILNNRLYCEAQGIVTVNITNCDCGSLSSCPRCFGMGEVREPVYPFELNLSNQNFADLWAALRLPDGPIDGRLLRTRLESIHCSELLKPTITSEEPGGPKIIDCGRHLDQVQRYWKELTRIAHEAERREEDVVWS